MRSRITFLLTALCAFGLTGCGESITPVRGRILLDGKPIEKGTQVIFVPEGDTPMAAATTDEHGRFKMADMHQKGGVMPGKYKVVLSNLTNFLPVPWNASPDNPSDPVWDKYLKDLEEMQSRPPQPGMLPLEYCNSATTPLTYTAPTDGSDVEYNVWSGAASPSEGK
jgi:hypothetical protein